MSYMRANFGGLTEGEAQFTQAARALMDELSDLEGKLKTKLNQWEGGAQEAYWRFQKDWDTAAKDMQTVVAQLGVAIRDAHDNYQAAERANTGIWG
ncbi:WXG100 family type VII secretion target [Actinomadura kijaniata]|uniref:WXG100 family type VII secretion target n=1 Tax=Actinomadura kijaniata TaxID=46161 RepID=UPI000A0342E3|nr:WXG100 family type VII secretion target [Actinomadura kijaniata]